MSNILSCGGHELKIPNIVDSDGVYLFDDSGTRYMDLESGVWCAALGHKNSGINEAINQQINAITHTGFCYSSDIVEDAAESVLSVTQLQGGKCVFLSSGSEAIELLRQITQHLMGRQKILALHDAYLGSYESVKKRGADWHSFDWQDCQTCSINSSCDPNCKALQAIPNDISVFIFEPGSASGFVRFPPKAMIQNIVNLVRSHHGKIIVNEVTTGVGRTGKWFAHQHYDIEPDMIALGKGIGNGYPVSVAVFNSATAKEFEAGSASFSYMQSHQNDPLGAAVVKQVIQLIHDDDLIAQAAKKGERFLDQLNALVDNKIVTAVRGRGLMFAIEIVSESVTDAIYNDLIKKGYIVCNRGSFLRIDPPLIITERQFSQFIETFAAIVASR